jgi:hypothetical protein
MSQRENGHLVPIDEQSTVVKHPPYWESMSTLASAGSESEKARTFFKFM